MNLLENKRLKNTFAKALILICGVILIDFVAPKEEVETIVVDKTRVLENKQSVARNYYYAYYITTEEAVVPVSESFQKKSIAGDAVKITFSPIFNEVHRVTAVQRQESEIYSQRIFSGCILPLLGIGILGLGFRKGARVNTLVFATEVVLIINFIYLLY